MASVSAVCVGVTHGDSQPHHAADFRFRGVVRGKGCRMRFERQPDFAEVMEEFFVDAIVEVPGQHIAVEQVPLVLGGDPRADSGARDDQALCRQVFIASRNTVRDTLNRCASSGSPGRIEPTG